MSNVREEIENGVRHLRRVDPVIRAVIEKTGPYALKCRRDRFQSLVSSIIAQQISGSAARAIRQRLFDQFAPEKLTAHNLCSLTTDELRKVGLSTQKAAYIHDLSNRVASGELRLDRLARWSDEQVIDELIKVKGIGVWTAQMFLIFSLGRLDVFPHDDLGVRTAIRNLYRLEDLPDKVTSHRIAEPWRPYASIASWYCWRSLDVEN